MSKPWIGFAVRKAPGKAHLLVHDVAENGPAQKAGLMQGDEISHIDGRPVPTPEVFKEMLRNFHVGKELDIDILRDDRGVDNAIKKTCRLIVATKTREPIRDPPPLHNSNDVELILKDRTKLEKCNTVFFDACDADMSGLVTRAEFAATMGPWFETNLGYPLSNADLLEVFDSHDADKSGFMRKSEFISVTQRALEVFLEKHPSTTGGGHNAAHHPGHPTPAGTPMGGAHHGGAPPPKKKTWKEKLCCCFKKKH